MPIYKRLCQIRKIRVELNRTMCLRTASDFKKRTGWPLRHIMYINIGSANQSSLFFLCK